MQGQAQRLAPKGTFHAPTCKYMRLWLCSPRMERVLELIENGRAGYVAAMGMGGVFTALIFRFLFIILLGKIYRFSRLRGRKKNAPASSPPPPAGGEEPAGEEIAAALAAALALAGQSRRTGVSLPSGPASDEPSPWKTAGRLSMMRPFVRPKKD
jgi:Na+-transporting methylmalonyl-CoA/oxaloacetate decarboxylase gamma subunit